MEKEILLLKEEVSALRQQIESLNKKLDALNLNLRQKELSGVEKKGVEIVEPPMFVDPMEHPYAEIIKKLVHAQRVKTLKNTERYEHSTTRIIKPNSRFKK